MKMYLEVDSKLNFDEQIPKICNKSSRLPNALYRIGDSIGFKKEIYS